ncbi:hypothetical protein EFL95_02630 [Nocardioides marmorisolisilvae]|uniref:Uncharacterized protein n=1 Tax=Nocardioides marmorisolisilvae TaxID=1542737 RepID=A0A3N0E0A8_9ACTN|nr:hypothetical protein EFL95_02630 [Nocardioides marmorisolisilvae]
MLAPVAPASAVEPVCTIAVPYKVTAGAPLTWVKPTFTGCDSYASASWKVARSGKTYGTITAKNGVNQGSWIFHDNWPTGMYAVTPSSSAAVPQNSTKAVVKFGTKVTLKGYRQDHLKVPLSGTITRYVASVDGYRGWAHRYVSIQYRDCTTCDWHPLYSDRTDAHGKFSLAAVSDELRYYRARIGDTTYWWGSTSSSVHF